MKFIKLEAIRGFAALYIVLHHYISYSLLKDKLPHLLVIPFRFGQEAVSVFFLLSGFVIYYSTASKNEVSWQQYFTRRMVRIYPIAIAALLLSILVAVVANQKITQTDLYTLFGNILMLQDGNKPGSFILPFLSNYPLWSLSYEWWFYMLFFPVLGLVRSKALTVPKMSYPVLLFSLVAWVLQIAGPNHFFLVAAYFSLWWCGAVCARIYMESGTFTLYNMRPVLITLLVMVIATFVPLAKQYADGAFTSSSFYLIPFRHHAFALLILIAGLIWWQFKLWGFNEIFLAFAKLAPVSYAMYIIHFIFIWPVIGVINPYILLLAKLFIVMLLSYILEIKFQPIVSRFFFSRILQKPGFKHI